MTFVKLLIILAEKNALFDSLKQKITNYSEIREVIYDILFMGKDIPYSVLDNTIDTAEMFGFVTNRNNKVVILNRIFETMLYDYFLSRELLKSDMYNTALRDKNETVDVKDDFSSVSYRGIGYWNVVGGYFYYLENVISF